MKNIELINLYANLKELKELTGVKFSYAIAKNIKIIENEIENINASLKQTKEEEEYNKKYKEICIKHSIKDDNGEPIVKREGNYESYSFDNKELFDIDIENLRKENKEVLELIKEKEKNYNKFLNEEISNDIKLFKIELQYIPENITTEQMNNIFEIVIEDANIK